MKKTLAIILSVLMIVCMMPATAFATGKSLNDATITIEPETYTYTGKAIEPKVTAVTLSGNNDPANLEKLDVSYSDNTVAGTATVTVKPKAGDDTYTGEVSKTFTIEKASFNISNFKFNSDIPVATDRKDKLTVSEIGLTYNELPVAESDFTIGDLPPSMSAGNYEVKLASKGVNFKAGESFEITVRAGIDITGYTIKVKGKELKDLTAFTYTGRAQEFTKSDITLVKADQTAITSNSFNVAYKDNVDAYNGKATITVTGISPYVGNKSGTFNISPYNIDQNVSQNLFYIQPLDSVPEMSKPKPVVKLGGTTGVQLIEGKDFTYDYSQKPSAANKIKVGIVGKSPNCTGSKYVEYTTGKDISKTVITLDGYLPTSGYPKYTYDGSRHQPTVLVMDGSYTLRNGTDYRLTYENDVNASNTPLTSYKPAKVIIKGIGTYAGEISKEYTIEKKFISNLRLSMSSSMAYIPVSNTSKYMPSFTFYDTNGRALILGTDYDVSSYSYVNDTTKAAVNITLAGKGNYDGHYYGYNVVLNGTSMANCRVELSQNSYKYTGYAHTPTVKVYNGSTLVPSTYYIVSYKNNKDAGTASATVTGTNGYTGSQTVYFTITGNTINTCTATLSQTTYKYDGLYKEPTVIVKDGYTTLTRNVDYKLTYSNNRAAGTATVLITGIGKYSGSMTKEFTIQGIDQTVKTKYTKYTRYPTSSNFRIAATADGDGTGFTYTSSDPSVAKVSSDGEVEIIGTGIGKITVATKGTTRYNPASKVITVTVKPNKPVIKVTSPSEGEIKVLITKVKGATKYQVRYGRNDKYYNKYITHKENEYTKTSTTIKNRKSGVYYYVQVRAYKTLENGDKVWGNWTTLRKVRAK